MEITDDPNAIEAALRAAKTINVLRFKEEGAVFSVTRYLVDSGYGVTGVNPKRDRSDLVAVVSSLDDAESADIVVVFRRSEALPGHLDQFLASGASTIWFQLGIRNDAVATQLVEAGFDVVQDRCIKVEHARLIG